jgi:hypothetical protein
MQNVSYSSQVFTTSNDISVHGINLGTGIGNVSTNTYMGNGAGTNATQSGGNNTGFGYQSMGKVTTGNANVAFGVGSLFGMTGGIYNTAVGVNSCNTMTNATRNTGIGAASLSNTTGDGNTALGYDAGWNLQGGQYNTFLGSGASGGTQQGVTSGSYNTFVGAQITGLAAGLSNTVGLSDGQGVFRYWANSTGTCINCITPLATLTDSGSVSFPIKTISANYTCAAVDHTLNCITNSFTVTLPTAVGIKGTIYVVKNNGAATTITMATTSSQTIDGSGTMPTLATTIVMWFQSDGANWIRIM